MNWVDLDLEGPFVKLYDTKNGEDRNVPLTPRAVAILNSPLTKSALDTSGLV